MSVRKASTEFSHSSTDRKDDTIADLEKPEKNWTIKTASTGGFISGGPCLLQGPLWFTSVHRTTIALSRRDRRISKLPCHKARTSRQIRTATVWVQSDLPRMFRLHFRCWMFPGDSHHNLGHYRNLSSLQARAGIEYLIIRS